MTLQRKIEKAYADAMAKDRQIAAIEVAAREGTATLKDAGIYASKSGLRTGQALADWMQDLVEESEIDLTDIVKTALRRGYTDTAAIIDAAVSAQNASAGTSLKAIVADFDDARAAGIAQVILDSDDPAGLAEQLRTISENYILSGLDESIRKNAEFQDASGLETVVIRTYDGQGLHDKHDPCEWCLERVGTWSYADAIANGVFERHPGCECLIEYESKKTGTHTRSSGGGWTDI